MLDRWGRRAAVIVGRHDVRLFERRRWPRQAARWLADEPLPQGPTDASTTGAALERLLARHDGVRSPVSVLVSDDLARYWQVDAPANASRPADLMLAAAMRFESAYDESAQGWTIDGDWSAQGAFLCASLPQSLRDVLVSTLARQGMPVVALLPEFLAVWNHWAARLPRDCWLVAWRERSAVLGVGMGRRLVAVRRLAHEGATRASAGWLEDQITREALRMGIEPPRTVAVCGPPAAIGMTPTSLSFNWIALGAPCDAATLLGHDA